MKMQKDGVIEEKNRRKGKMKTVEKVDKNSLIFVLLPNFIYLFVRNINIAILIQFT